MARDVKGCCGSCCEEREEDVVDLHFDVGYLINKDRPAGKNVYG